MSSNTSTNLFPKTPMTASAKSFFFALHASLQFFSFIVNIAASTDFSQRILQRGLENKDYNDIDNPVDLAKKEPGPATKFLRKHRQTLLEMYLSRTIDNFQTYIVDLIREILKKEPNILKTSQIKMTLEEILKYGSMEELVNDNIESKVNSLSYKGFLDLEEWASDKGIEIVTTVLEKDSLVELIETRNLIVHNRGIVDAKYIRSIKDSKFKLGDLRVLNPDTLSTSLELIANVVVSTDKSAAKKFALKQDVFEPDVEGKADVSDDREQSI